VIEPADTRVDIQALRGLAILFVLAYHSRLVPVLHAGFLGVDIFFVISGFLITGIVSRQLAAGTFSFATFYFRRARRILPAAYLMLGAVALASAFLLAPAAQAEFQQQLKGSVFYYANIALWQQSGYFDSEATRKPLLHMWSLAIEEQYYLLLPAALVLLPSRLRRPAVVVAIAASLGLCLATVATRPAATFYLLPTRAWELGIGSLGALLPATAAQAWARRLFFPAVGGVLLVPWLPAIGPHPGVSALLVCTFTLLVLLARRVDWDRTRAVVALAWFGAISYPLYLVHWPLLTFAKIAYLGTPPWELRLALVIVSVGLAWLIYRYVETPIRHSVRMPSRGFVASILMSSLLLVGLVPAVALGTSPPPGFDRSANYGFAPECAQEGDFIPLAACQRGGAPRIMVWGDSYAMHLVNAVAASTKVSIIQATRPICGPLLGLAPVNEGNFGQARARSCIKFNQDVLDYVAKTPSLEVVVLSSPFSQYLGEGTWGGGFRVMQASQHGYDVVNPDEHLAVATMAATIQQLHALGKRVIVVSRPPSGEVPIGDCLEQRMSGKLVLGEASGRCAIPVSAYRFQHARMISFIERLPQEAKVPTLNFDRFLCDAQWCETTLHGVPLYRDSGHLSKDGAFELGRSMKLGEKLLSQAR
jgi:peptidoglycan/LPS O-acetylase OafA/YrhL